LFDECLFKFIQLVCNLRRASIDITEIITILIDITGEYYGWLFTVDDGVSMVGQQAAIGGLEI